MAAKRGKPISEAAFRRLWLDPKVPASLIANQLGITIQAVRFRAVSRGLPNRKGGGGLNRKIDPALFREMWDANVGQAAIAAYFGCHIDCVAKRSREWGFPKRHCNRWNAISIAGFLLARSASETAAALRMAEMVDNFQVGRWAGRTAA